MEECFESSNETLQFVALLIRHGERGPLFIHQDDPNKHLWPNGASNITQLGKQQSFEVGQHFRQRYDGYLSPTYHSGEIYVRSTDTDRCLATAQGCMAGLFGGQGTDLWDAANSWQPVPIHTIPEAIDPCSLKVDGFVEPRLPHLAPEIYQHFQKHKDFYDVFTKASGKSSSDCLFDRLAVLNSVFLEKMLGLSTTPHDCGKSIEEMAPVAMQMHEFAMTKYPGIVVPAAETMDLVLGVIGNKVDGKTPQLKSYFLFTHDFIIGCILKAITGKIETPGYVGMMLFELHKHPKTEELYVKIIYKGDLKKEQREINLPGFGSLCPVAEFNAILKSFVIPNKSGTPSFFHGL